MNLNFYTYKVPFTQPFHTAKTHFINRKGIYISLQKDGITSLGEAAPLPGFSTEDLPAILNEIQQYSEAIFTHFSTSFSLKDTLQWLKTQEFSPSLQFGLYSLAAGYVAQQNRSSLQNTLCDSAISHIKLNAVLGRENFGNVVKINQLINSGYKTIKIKAGKNWKEIIPVLKKIRTKNNAVNIRIDANQSWTLDQAQTCFQNIKPYNIEYCEEPLDEPQSTSLRKLSDTTSVPIALDESIIHTFTLTEAIKIAPVLIIKPMVLGYPTFSEALYNQARAHNTTIVFTTALEGGVGRLMTTALAAGLGSDDTAHGLATGHLLGNDIWRDDAFMNNGYFTLPDAQRFASLMNSDLSDLPVQKVLSYA